MRAITNCAYIKAFQQLFCTPKYFSKSTCTHKYLPSPPINFDAIIEFMKLDNFDDIHQDIFSGSHECISLNISDLNFTVIEFLVQNNLICFENKPNTFYIIDIIIQLFYEIHHNDVVKSRVSEYIDYFWNIIIEKNKKLIIENFFDLHINNCFDINIKSEYTQKYNQLVSDVNDDSDYVDSAFLVEVVSLIT
jgi:hypothetical protein